MNNNGFDDRDNMLFQAFFFEYLKDAYSGKSIKELKRKERKREKA